MLNLCSGSLFGLKLIPGVFAIKLRCQENNVERVKYLEPIIQELAKKLEFSKPIELMETDNPGLAIGCTGVGLFGRAGIIINPEFACDLNLDELEFILAHELAHIKANDYLRLCTAICVAGVISTLAASILVPSTAVYFTPAVIVLTKVSSPAAMVGQITSLFVKSIYSKRREKCADLLALSICSNEGKKAASDFFEKMRQSQLSYRNRNMEDNSFSSLYKKITITKDGNTRLDIFHPSLKERSEYLKSARE